MKAEEFVAGVQELSGLTGEMMDRLIDMADALSETDRAKAYADLQKASDQIVHSLEAQQKLCADGEHEMQSMLRKVAMEEEFSDRSEDIEKAEELINNS